MQSKAFLPPSFLAAMDAIMPSGLSREDFAAACQRPLRKAIRVNTLKINVADFQARMAPKGWQLSPIPWCESGFWVARDDESKMLGNEPEHQLGLFYVQEASSMMPPTALWHVLEGQAQKVLDMAAAPGSKTTQLAALMQNGGVLVANELSSSRLKSMAANIQRLGVANVALSHFDGRVFGNALPETFDAILLDAPCGGEGTIRKDADALKNWSQSHIDEISALQQQLLASAFSALKVGGVLAYSTCTLNRQENQHVLDSLIKAHPGKVEVLSLEGLFEGAHKALTEEGYLHIWPQIYDSEGFFVAAIKKTGSVESEPPGFKLGKFPYQSAPKKVAEAFGHYLAEQFGFTQPLNLWQREQTLWHFPKAGEALIGRFRMDRLGIKVAEQAGKEWRLHQDFIQAFGQHCHSIALSLEEASEFLKGRDIARDTPAGGEQLVSLEGYPLGSVKVIKNKLKNRLPRELVKDQGL
ncbi:16S rRNA (cytosine(1407)-C(5))-methyltransferase RsmF [Gallaecimonas pentaromativorans]|uniref:16S rRNA m(5)C-1407 methyltransferase n=1 Tax=Gallaecimonas pentaromativorans TaxID=584787 RepID=A0A3N1P6B6_9GAMM|nr:16S rRNA (cytosine(1407)-C(5))-methyltransferase RsmF [Gallaecimonas pentaromativorans]ROQ27554.1 16S rRNA m(5)C-1407 methyltransferase [Gallaecimonas pentaromativorans]